MSDAIDEPTFRALQATAGADFVVELVDAFLEEAPKMLATLRDSLAEGDEATFRRAAHSLKSNSFTFGAQGLGEIARQLELGYRDVVQKRDTSMLDAIEAELHHVAATLRQLRNA